MGPRLGDALQAHVTEICLHFFHIAILCFLGHRNLEVVKTIKLTINLVGNSVAKNVKNPSPSIAMTVKKIKMASSICK